MEKDSSDNKHKKYFSSYKPNDFFWGIGIENEIYLEKESLKVSGSFFKNQKRERYSVNYYDTYLNDYFNKVLDSIIEKDKEYKLPVLINCHELLKNDLSGEPMNNYNTASTPNIKFSGKTVFQYMKEKNKYFEKEFEKSFCFDGDTIEFMTQTFYKTTINKVVDELILHKKTFLSNLNKLHLPYGTLKYPEINHGFATFTTNQNNLAIFNNGTYHFNFTLPTLLDSSGNILDKKDFEKRHSNAIKIIQLMEPFFIAKFGSADILSTSPTYLKRFPKGSQRCAASRYIGVGTYDPSKMISGKLLQDDRKSIERKYYNMLYQQIHYNKTDKIGFDINYNKFLNHGIELRFFDWFPEEHLYKVLRFIVYLLDFSESSKEINNYIRDDFWNNITYKALLDGKDSILTGEELIYIRKQFNIKDKIRTNNIVEVYDYIDNFLEKKFGYNGPVGKYMLEKPSIKKLFFKFCGW
jgi:hypothetical protein